MALTKTDVSQLYVSIFGRASEGEGNKFWQLNFTDAKSAVNEMLKYDVVKAYFGDTINDNQKFIEHIYSNTLNKTYAQDKDGIDFWVNALNSGMDKGEVVASLINSAVTIQTEIEAGSTAYDAATVAAAQQFKNRVEVSNYVATNIENVPADGDLSVFQAYNNNTTHVVATKDAQIEKVDNDVAADGKTFTLTPSSTSVNEGGTVTYSITNGEANTEYTYTISGVSAADISASSLTGTVTTNAAGAATFTVTTVEDGATEGAETMVVTIDSKTASVTVNDTSAAPDSVLTTAGDRLDGEDLTSGNDTILAPQGTLGSTDVIIDASTTDSDSLTAYVSTEVAPTIQKIENVNLIWTSNTDLVFDAANSSDNTFNLSSNSGVFSGNATVKNVGRNDVVADAATITGTLAVQGAIDTTIDAGSATAVSLTKGTVTTVGVKTTADLTINNNVSLTNIAATGAENLTIRSTVDDVTVSGATAAGDIVDKLTIAGDKSIVYNGKIDGEEIVNELTGDATLTVKTLATATTINTGKIDADLIDLALSATTVTVNDNQNFKFADTITGTVAFQSINSVTDATVNLELNGNSAAGGINIKGIKTLNLDVAKDSDIKALLVDGNNKVNITGDKALTITAFTGSTAAEAIEVDASELTGKFKVTSTSIVDSITSITGSDTAENDITTASQAVKTVVNTGSANDTIVANSVTSGELIVNAGDGNNTINADALTLAATATITTGSGDDSINSSNAATFTLAKKLKIDAGNGKNTIDLSKQTTGFLEITTGSGDDTIKLTAFATAGSTANANASTITTGAGTDTVDLSAYNAGKLTVTSGTGKTTVTLKANSLATQEFTFKAGSTSDVLVLGTVGTAGAAGTVINTSAAKVFDITSVSNLHIVEGSTLAGWQLSGEDFNIKGLTAATTAIDSDGTMTVKVVDVGTDLKETTDLSSLNFSTTKTEYIKTVTVTGLANVADTIKGSTQNDEITAGGGSVKDIIDISQGGNDTIKIATANDSTYAKDADYMDAVIGFKTGLAVGTDLDTDTIDFSGAAIVAKDASGVDVSSAVADAGTFSVTASITDGIMTVGGADLLKIDTLLEWIAVANIVMADTTDYGSGNRVAADNDTVAFEFGGDTYVYNQTTIASNVADIVQLVDVTGVVAVDTTEAANTIHIA
ncbi:beta strand repeat-containing protein [Aliarcobacter cryaerophilus]|nr:DUF4214 domain-containing protein [Aliarcobacter cryaerophilus]